MTDKIFTSVGPQGINTSGYQFSDLDDIEFYWEIDQSASDSNFRPGTDGLFPQQLLTFWRLEDQQKTSISSTMSEKNEEPPTKPMFDRSNRRPAPLRSRAFGTRNENVTEYVHRHLFQ